MTFFTVPVKNNLPWYKFKITLSGVIFTLSFRYNSRTTRWLMDILDSSENPVLMGLPLLINRNVTSQYPTFAIPEGVFFATDDTGKNQEAGLFSFGTDHSLWYEDPLQ